MANGAFDVPDHLIDDTLLQKLQLQPMSSDLKPNPTFLWENVAPREITFRSFHCLKHSIQRKAFPTYPKKLSGPDFWVSSSLNFAIHGQHDQWVNFWHDQRSRLVTIWSYLDISDTTNVIKIVDPIKPTGMCGLMLCCDSDLSQNRGIIIYLLSKKVASNFAEMLFQQRSLCYSSCWWPRKSPIYKHLIDVQHGAVRNLHAGICRRSAEQPPAHPYRHPWPHMETIGSNAVTACTTTVIELVHIIIRRVYLTDVI